MLSETASNFRLLDAPPWHYGRHFYGVLEIKFKEALKYQIQGEESEVNVMKWLSRAALEYIDQGGLGYTFEALDETKTNTYIEAIKLFRFAVLSLCRLWF